MRTETREKGNFDSMKISKNRRIISISPDFSLSIHFLPPGLSISSDSCYIYGFQDSAQAHKLLDRSASVPRHSTDCGYVLVPYLLPIPSVD